MSASGLLTIKKRIESIKSTQKVTRAMALIAKSKLRKVKEKLSYSEMYFSNLEQITKDIFYASDDMSSGAFCKKYNSQKKLYIIFASDTGFCGSFNSSFSAYLNDIYKKTEDKKDIEVIVIGQRAISYVKNKGFNIIKKYEGIGDFIDLSIAKKLVDEIISMYLGGEYLEISVLNIEYKAQNNQQVVCNKILPIEFETEVSTKRYFSLDIDEEEVIHNYIEGKIIHSFYNSLASEQSLRMQSMDAATKNAQEIIDNLSSKYNRIRQAAITQEISEIVVGAQAQK